MLNVTAISCQLTSLATELSVFQPQSDSSIDMHSKNSKVIFSASTPVEHGVLWRLKQTADSDQQHAKIIWPRSTFRRRLSPAFLLRHVS
jgi:hypothetical protein